MIRTVFLARCCFGFGRSVPLFRNDSTFHHQKGPKDLGLCCRSFSEMKVLASRAGKLCSSRLVLSRLRNLGPGRPCCSEKLWVVHGGSSSPTQRTKSGQPWYSICFSRAGWATKDAFFCRLREIETRVMPWASSRSNVFLALAFSKQLLVYLEPPSGQNFSRFAFSKNFSRK